MPRLKVLSGKDLVKIFTKYGFEKIDQTGSHLKMRRISRTEKQTLIIPMHKEIDKGLLRQIFNQSSKYIPSDNLEKDFFV
jgi:predicted RNA binding protein YcfA (HicA-like mRNA interferase family)